MKIIDSIVPVKGIQQVEANKEITDKSEVWAYANDANENDAYLLDIGTKAYPYRAVPTYTANSTSMESVEDQNTEVKLKLIESVIFHFTGRTVKLHASKVQLESLIPIAITMQNTTSQEARDGWGLIYEYQDTAVEQQCVNYSAGGSVTTSDGRVLNFRLEFHLFSDFTAQSRMMNPADDKQVGDERFGYMTGRLSDALKLYVFDGTGWMKKTDGTLKKLQILQSSGQQTLVSLGNAGIGAICLKEVASSFSFKDSNSEHIAMRDGSFYLKETKKNSANHHIDLAL